MRRPLPFRKPQLLGPLLAAFGLLLGLVGELAGSYLPASGPWAAAHLTVLGAPLHQQAIVWGLSVGAAGLVVWAIVGLRARGPRLRFLLLLLSGVLFFAAQIHYLLADYRWISSAPLFRLNAELIDYGRVLQARVVVSAGILVCSCALGLLPRVRKQARGGAAKRKNPRRR